MNKSLTGGIAVLVVLALVGFIFVSANSDDDDEPATTTTTQSASDNEDDDAEDTEDQDEDSDAPANIETFTAAMVAMHSTEDDCWTIINDKVYDITSYLPRHPGGDVILQACGTDGTSLFFERTTSDGETVGSGTPHSGNATAQLQSLYLGDLES